jgi:TonB-linked SusC/RagA family outer membrane protein
VSSRAIFFAVALAAAFVAPANLQAQTGTVSGTVTNKQSGEPLASVQVYLQNTNYNAITDASGRFVLAAVRPGTYTAIAQLIGFTQGLQHNLSVASGAAAAVNFQLTQAVLPMQELVATGVSDPTAGIKAPFTVAKVTAEQLQVPAAGQALASLAGKVAGASIIRTTGKPGAGGLEILLRTSTAAEGVRQNDPLFVVDGVILSRGFANDGDVAQSIADIDPADIESIEVIKGAAASSIYGSRAAAGVISIKTKRGANTPLGQTRVNYRMEIGQDFIGREMPLSTHHAYRLNAAGTAFVNAAGRDTTWLGRTVDPNREVQDQSYPGPTYDNIKALFRPDQFLTQNITLSQNSANTTFLIALNRWDQSGTLANNDGYWRNQGRINLDHRVGDKFSVALTGLHSRSWEDNLAGGGTSPYELALTYPPFVDLQKKDANGQYLQLPDSTVLTENPLWRQATRDNFSTVARTQASTNVRYSPLRWVTLDAQLSYDRSDNHGQSYTPKGVATSVTEDAPSLGSLDLTNRRSDAYNGSIGATFLRQFGSLSTRTLFRASFERDKGESFASGGEDFVVQGVRDLSAITTLDNVTSSTTDNRSNAYLVNLGLDYRDRFVVDGLVRRDGSSLFGPLNKWHTFYRGAISYRMSGESWFNVGGVDELVFRYSIGTAGSRPRYDQQYTRWNVSRTTGLSRGNAGNATLKPQFTREQEFGVNSILFGNRLSVELVYARQTTKDQIIGVPIPTLTGFNTVAANAGIVSGHTYEATINARVINTRDVSLNLAAVMDRSRNTIEHWGRACFYGHTIATELDNHSYSCTGEHRGDFWGQKFVQSVEDLPGWTAGRESEFEVNDEGYLVYVGPGNHYTEGISKKLWGTSAVIGPVTYQWGEPFFIVDDNNVGAFYKLGTSLADLNFGLTPNIRWKNLSVYAEVRGQIGGQIFNAAKQDLYNSERHADLDQTGKPDELKKTIDYYDRGLRAGNRFVPAFIEDGDFLKVGALSARYRFTHSQLEKVLRSVAPQDLSIGVVARNLVTFTGYSGYDPEAGRALSRVEDLGYPQMRTFTMTLDITF